jgi:hypothetical protein
MQFDMYDDSTDSPWNLVRFVSVAGNSLLSTLGSYVLRIGINTFDLNSWEIFTNRDSAGNE